MNTVVFGCLWGDEAKAKVVQSVLKDYDVVVRYQGAANAGHTVYLNDGSKLVLHSIPVGAICEDLTLVISAGCLISPEMIVDEIKQLESRGIDIRNRLKIYSNTTVTTDFEIQLDKAREAFLSGDSSKIGTTGRGIGPSYSNRFFRTAILFQDLFNDKVLRDKLMSLSQDMNPRLRAYGAEEIDPMTVFDKLRSYQHELLSFMVYPNYVYSLIEARKNILFEGAQGALLCPINGTYPFVTAFPVSPASIPISCNIPMKSIDKTIGVLKAYPTRVGEGPFPTQILDDREDILVELGKEYGATTGRKRKCGWPDLAIASYVIRSFGIDELALTCLDTLCKFSEQTGPIKVCNSYLFVDKKYTIPESATASYLSRVQPVYQEIDLSCDCSGVRDVSHLPLHVNNFISLIVNATGVPIKMISTGPNKEDLIIL